jgi:hypothetical protein
MSRNDSFQRLRTAGCLGESAELTPDDLQTVDRLTRDELDALVSHRSEIDSRRPRKGISLNIIV